MNYLIRNASFLITQKDELLSRFLTQNQLFLGADRLGKYFLFFLVQTQLFKKIAVS